MEQFGLALILFASFWVGCAAGYIAMRLRTQVSYEKGRSESAAEIATANERLAAKENLYNEAKQKAELAATAVARLESELKAETDRRTMAEAKLGLLPKYEAELAAQSKKAEEQALELNRLHGGVADLTARLEESRKAAAEKIVAMQLTQDKLAETIQNSTAETVKASQESFLSMAGEALSKIRPLEAAGETSAPALDGVKDSLDRVSARIAELEAERTTSLGALAQQVESLLRAQTSLHEETAQLKQSLRLPSARGNWGELQLRRVVEASGMDQYCVFAEPDSGHPDMIVQLPGGRHIVVDAKSSLAMYTEACESATDETRGEKLKAHAERVRAHITELSGKSYWDQFAHSPEFVIAFLPSEAYFGAALEQDSTLLEYGVERRVILSTPATLVALLKAVAWGWKQEKVSENARELRDLGRTLYDRIRALAENFTDVQRGLARTTAAFNKTVGTFENGVMPSARRFHELGASTGDAMLPPPPVDSVPRALNKLTAAVPVAEPAAVPAACE
ncbi:MAG: DNA recombination protein RmuC [Acidobacteria bacterium]|nr:DNA recombination protein RmuC [Acidobacteriota bacterium]